MSLAKSTPNRYSCAYCDGERDPENSVKGSYCSERCFLSQKGDKLLNLLRHDHKFCPTCSTQLKEIEEPTDYALRKIDGFHSTTSVVGFQYRTPEADIGEKGYNRPTGDMVHTGTVCGDCGTATLTEEFPEVQERHLFEYAGRILDTLEAKEEEHQKELNSGDFFNSLVESGDLAYSLGSAIEK